jgi:crotonobetainyl-CoA:carnitine CoA-transferase CaiB-like acyl-CoA transferase
MGFGYDVLKQLNPRIIMVNVSAYGQFGPYREKIGYDPIGQVMSGIAMVTGEEGMPPIRAGVPIIDRTTALHSAIGTLAALLERNISGQGQSIDVCLADSGYSFTEIPITAYHGPGLSPGGAGLMPRPAAPIPARMAGSSLAPATSTTGRACAALWGNRSGWTTRALPTAVSAANMGRSCTRRCWHCWPT